jgi:hypothetical protein
MQRRSSYHLQKYSPTVHHLSRYIKYDQRGYKIDDVCTKVLKQRFDNQLQITRLTFGPYKGLFNGYIDHVSVDQANAYIKEEINKRINPIFITSSDDLIPQTFSGRIPLDDFYNIISQRRIL